MGRTLSQVDVFLSGVFKNNAGERRYKLFRPGNLPPAGQRTLIVVLHGCTQDADDIARGTRFNEAAARDGFVVLYPEQPVTANPLKCWNWYIPEQIGRDQGEASIIAELTAKIVKDEGIAPARVFLTGVSAGGAMAANLVADYPELYSAVAIHSGLPAFAASSQAEALGVMAKGPQNPDALGESAHATMGARARVVPVLLLQGVTDHLISILNLRASARQWVVTNAKAAGTEIPEAVEVHPADQRLSGERFTLRDGTLIVESWRIDGVGHAWSGGAPDATYTDPKGPDATALILDFFGRYHPR